MSQIFFIPSPHYASSLLHPWALTNALSFLQPKPSRMPQVFFIPSPHVCLKSSSSQALTYASSLLHPKPSLCLKSSRRYMWLSKMKKKFQLTITEPMLGQSTSLSGAYGLFCALREHLKMTETEQTQPMMTVRWQKLNRLNPCWQSLGLFNITDPLGWAH